VNGDQAARYPVAESQRTARIAGLLYLLTMITANFAEFYVRGRLVVAGNATQTARNIAEFSQLFRIGIACDLFTLAATVGLLVALYLILKPINRPLALLAALWWLVECSIGAVVAANAVASSLLLSGVDPQHLVNAGQPETLARLLVSIDWAGNRVAGGFFGLGSIAFCYLWFKSRYIPRWLAAWGILSSLLPIVVQFGSLVLPTLQEAPLRRARSGLPILIFEVLLGLWLLIKGIKKPAAE